MLQQAAEDALAKYARQQYLTVAQELYARDAAAAAHVWHMQHAPVFDPSVVAASYAPPELYPAMPAASLPLADTDDAAVQAYAVPDGADPASSGAAGGVLPGEYDTAAAVQLAGSTDRSASEQAVDDADPGRAPGDAGVDDELSALLAWAYPGYSYQPQQQQQVYAYHPNQSRPVASSAGSGGAAASPSSDYYVQSLDDASSRLPLPRSAPGPSGHSSTLGITSGRPQYHSQPLEVSNRSLSAGQEPNGRRKRPPRHQLALAWRRSDGDVDESDVGTSAQPPLARTASEDRVIRDFVVTSGSSKAGTASHGQPPVHSITTSATAASGASAPSGAGETDGRPTKKKKRKDKQSATDAAATAAGLHDGADKIPKKKEKKRLERSRLPPSQPSIPVPAILQPKPEPAPEPRPRKPPVPLAPRPPSASAAGAPATGQTDMPQPKKTAQPQVVAPALPIDAAVPTADAPAVHRHTRPSESPSRASAAAIAGATSDAQPSAAAGTASAITDEHGHMGAVDAPSATHSGGVLGDDSASVATPGQATEEVAQSTSTAGPASAATSSDVTTSAAAEDDRAPAGSASSAAAQTFASVHTGLPAGLVQPSSSTIAATDAEADVPAAAAAVVDFAPSVAADAGSSAPHVPPQQQLQQHVHVQPVAALAPVQQPPQLGPQAVPLQVKQRRATAAAMLLAGLADALAMLPIDAAPKPPPMTIPPSVAPVHATQQAGHTPDVEQVPSRHEESSGDDTDDDDETDDGDAEDETDGDDGYDSDYKGGTGMPPAALQRGAGPPLHPNISSQLPAAFASAISSVAAAVRAGAAASSAAATSWQAQQHPQQAFPPSEDRTSSHAALAPSAAAQQRPLTDYSDIFPEFRSVFTGCLQSSLLIGAMATGGFARAGSHLNRGGSNRKDAAITPDLAAAHIFNVLRDWQVFKDGGPGAASAAERLVASAPAYTSDLSGAGHDALVADADDAGAAGAASDSDDEDDDDGRPSTPKTVRSMMRAHIPVPASAGPVRWIRVMDDRPEVLEIVMRGLEGRYDWREVPADLGTAPVWNLLWTWGKPPVQRNLLLVWQKVNHFRNANELTRKDLLKKNLSRYHCLGPRMAQAFALQPPTFVLPQQYLQFCDAFGRASSGLAGPTGKATDNMTRLLHELQPQQGDASRNEPNIWIMKPVGLSRGRGIRVISDIGQVRYSEDMIIQRYIHNPLLLDGHKFDLRIYVLVTSFSPLEAFIYERGFARLSSRPFSLHESGLSDRFIHLTNAAVQRGADRSMGCLDDATEADAGGTKCTLEYLWKRLSAQGIDTAAVWESIREVIVKSLVCVDDVIPHQPNSFELFGYDVMIDDRLKAWLIEVNSSPSMETDSAMDVRTKTELIRDTLAVVDPLPFDAAALQSVLQRRMANSESFSRRGPNAASASSGFGSGASQFGRISPGDKQQLNADLSGILYGRRPRVLGEIPSKLGAYQRICPGTDAFNRVTKLKLGHLRGLPTATASGVP